MNALELSRAAFFAFTLTFVVTESVCAAQPAAQSLTIGANSPLLSEPRADAAVVAQLKQGTPGEQLGKPQGLFVNVKTSAGTGWVYSFNVRYPAAGTAAAAGGGGAGFNTSGRITTATIGIRGLSAEDLRKTTIDPEQLKLLDSYAASAQDGEAAAAASGLAAVRFDYFSR